MPITPEQRERLDRLMNERRLELGITWRDVAGRAGISYEALRKLRSGEGGSRELTAAKISRSLNWEAASVASILSGGEPVAAGSAGGDDLKTPQCSFERRLLSIPLTPAFTAAIRDQIIRVHREMGHDAQCRPGRPEQAQERRSALSGTAV